MNECAETDGVASISSLISIISKMIEFVWIRQKQKVKIESTSDRVNNSVEVWIVKLWYVSSIEWSCKLWRLYVWSWMLILEVSKY